MTASVAPALRTATDDEIASVEEQLRLLFVRVRAVWKEAAAAVHPDLQPVGYKILSALVRRGPMHAGAIADALEIDKSVVSRQVKHLEQLGLASVISDPNDGRARVVQPTEQAIESVGQKGSRMQRQLYAKLRDWSAEDVERLARLLGRLTDEVVLAGDTAPEDGAPAH
ncbi:MarR family winged helix-turn-helix transcriptional regulator [Agromyces aurantiacus]|uniref:MarR family winged helix-turn-helix transcriptional regulator n=1 Tax=Agromyces aurantiacus TaxID=165814 RepID=A0ABV9R8U9_9MICO|nr:MarR family transcriptional regulator [Agromyces aurantiacus]MBM7503455.1 DNA-binding MarR family transcriptional regulator [Agromyces aurantiacus]